ncbi:hypothetical protein VTK26DRAFT_4392 [Humicola hyalothermophila]
MHTGYGMTRICTTRLFLFSRNLLSVSFTSFRSTCLLVRFCSSFFSFLDNATTGWDELCVCATIPGRRLGTRRIPANQLEGFREGLYSFSFFCFIHMSASRQPSSSSLDYFFSCSLRLGWFMFPLSFSSSLCLIPAPEAATITVTSGRIDGRRKAGRSGSIHSLRASGFDLTPEALGVPGWISGVHN